MTKRGILGSLNTSFFCRLNRRIPRFHFHCVGLFGLIASPLVRTGGVLSTFSGDSLNSLLWNSIGGCVLIGWHLVTGIILFVTLDRMGVLRVRRETEIQGLDLIKHKEPAYGFGNGTTPTGVNPFPFISKDNFSGRVGNNQVVSISTLEM